MSCVDKQTNAMGHVIAAVSCVILERGPKGCGLRIARDVELDQPCTGPVGVIRKTELLLISSRRGGHNGIGRTERRGGVGGGGGRKRRAVSSVGAPVPAGWTTARAV